MRPSSADRSTVDRADTPPSAAGLQAALELAADVPDRCEEDPACTDLVEATFGLRVGQVRALHAIGEQPTTVEVIAEFTGEDLAATSATLASLRDAGLTKSDGRGAVALTAAGRARRDQLAAVEFRLTAYLAEEVDEHRLGSAKAVDRLRTTTGNTELPPHRPAA